MKYWCALVFLEFAMSPNNDEVHIYAKKGNKWEIEHILAEVRNALIQFQSVN